MHLSRGSDAIGGGGEIAIGNDWSPKAEYLLARFGEEEISFPNAGAGVMITNGFGYPVTSGTVIGRRVMSKSTFR